MTNTISNKKWQTISFVVGLPLLKLSVVSEFNQFISLVHRYAKSRFTEICIVWKPKIFPMRETIESTQIVL